MSISDRGKVIMAKPAEIFGRLDFYPLEDGGPKWTKVSGYMCPCYPQKNTKMPGWDVAPQFGDTPMIANEIREMGFVFLSGEKAVRVVEQWGELHLWDGRFIGRVEILEVLI